jgi:hypothetical protein
MPGPNKENPKCDVELRYRRCFSKYLLALSDDCRPAIRPEHWMMGGPWSCSDVVQKLAHPAAETDGLIVDEQLVCLRSWIITGMCYRLEAGM